MENGSVPVAHASVGAKASGDASCSAQASARARSCQPLRPTKAVDRGSSALRGIRRDALLPTPSWPSHGTMGRHASATRPKGIVPEALWYSARRRHEWAATCL
eukprot:4614133-Prymnesium_polylepis.2